MGKFIIFLILILNLTMVSAEPNKQLFSSHFSDLKNLTKLSLIKIVSNAKHIKKSYDFLKLEELALYSKMLSLIDETPIRLGTTDNFLELKSKLGLNDFLYDLMLARRCGYHTKTLAFVAADFVEEGIFLCLDTFMDDGVPLNLKISILLHEMAHVIGIRDESTAERLALVGLMISGLAVSPISEYYYDDEKLRTLHASAYKHFFTTESHELKIGDTYKIKLELPFGQFGMGLSRSNIAGYSTRFTSEGAIEFPIAICELYDATGYPGNPDVQRDFITFDEVNILESQFIDATVKNIIKPQHGSHVSYVTILLAVQSKNYYELNCSTHINPDYQTLTKLGAVKSR